MTLSQDSKFHAIFATSSIPEAITYYRLLKAQCPQLNITALFDPNISDDDKGSGNGNGNVSDPVFKTNGLVEILTNYNTTYGQSFDLGSHACFKKDVAARLAHKAPYICIEKEPSKRLDLLIVVNQTLTGFDSKWINALYLDKLLEYENIIQAFSRTNRLFGPDKPFGTVRYYRKPHTMTRNVAAAVKLYSGDNAIGLFANRLPSNLERINEGFAEMAAMFEAAVITDLMRLPDDKTERAAFAKCFQAFNTVLEAAKIQGFDWEKSIYAFDEPSRTIALSISHHQYLTLLQRYKELGSTGAGAGGGDDIAFDIDSHITEIDTGKIDADYMNSRFEKYLKVLQSGNEQAKETTLSELHRSFSSLSQADQKVAEIFLHDIQRGEVKFDPARTFRDYLASYKAKEKKQEIETIERILGIDALKLAVLMSTKTTELNLNEFGRFDELKATVNQAKAKTYFESMESAILPLFRVNIKAAALLKRFVLEGGFALGGEAIE